MATCEREKDHRLPPGFAFAGRGCKHKRAEAMSRADFRKLPVVKCIRCTTALGRLCPECARVY